MSIPVDKRISDMNDEEWAEECQLLAGNPALNELMEWQLSGGQSKLSLFGESKAKLLEAQKVI